MLEGIPAAINPANELDVMLDWIALNYRADNLTFDSPTISTSFGDLGITGPHTDDYDGTMEYIRVGFVLSDGIYAEIDGDTYGQLQAFRIYKDI